MYEVVAYLEVSKPLRAATKKEEVAVSMSRIYDHTKNRPFAALTAFRGEYSLAENRDRNKDLIQQVRDAGFGFAKVKGRYIENKGTDKENPVDEESIMVFAPKGTDMKAFEKFVTGLGSKFDQDSVLVKSPDNDSAELVITSPTGGDVGDRIDVGQWRPGNTGEFFSVFHGGSRKTGKGMKSFEFKDDGPVRTVKNLSQPAKNKSSDMPNWWTSMSRENQESYLEEHPSSKAHKWKLND